MKITLKKLLTTVLSVVTIAIVNESSAYATTTVVPDTVFIPERAVVLTGDAAKLDKDIVTIFYSRENLEFQDPSAPRFLLLDRKGQIMFGIGGQLYATASYDMRGAVDGVGFSTYDINVPANPAQMTRFGADLSHSSLFIRLVGKDGRVGTYQVYFQSNFTGNNGGYGFKLKQAYVGIGHFTVGLTNSTFVDGSTQAPTVDTAGSSGENSGKNVLFRYTTPTRKGFSAAFSVELPQTSYTLAEQTERLSARVPDIPAYLQYSWKAGNHVRLSAIFRDMAYRDLVTGKNHLTPGWGVQLSTISNIDPAGKVQFFGHATYGQGIGQYFKDLSGNGYDLVYSKEAGKMVAPRLFGWSAGLYVHATRSLFFTGSFGRAQAVELKYLGPDSYHYGQYFDINGFYDIDANFRVGAEYCRGWRQNYDGELGHANRVSLLLQYAF